jgi:hypothetical protein
MSITSKDWLTAAEALAKSAQRPGESYEAAFARVTAKGAGAGFLHMHRNPQGRIPGKLVLKYRGQTDSAETKLHKMAVEAANESGESYEQAFSKLLATPEGEKLWMQSRAEDKK